MWFVANFEACVRTRIDALGSPVISPAQCLNSLTTDSDPAVPCLDSEGLSPPCSFAEVWQPLRRSDNRASAIQNLIHIT
jgi:hypothetical protein